VVRVHTSHWPYGYSPFTLCSWQWGHKNPWCSLCHLCCHHARCWFPCGMRTTTCISFNHIQFLLSMNWHCIHQRWHLHLSWRCHCRLNASRFTSLILHNSKIHYLRCDSSQKKELSQLTPHWSIPPISNWGIWMFIKTSWCVFTWSCQYHMELERAKRPSSFLSWLFFFDKKFQSHCKRCKHLPS
jgi:hypothetical protein